MATTYTLISSNVLSSSAASVTFSSIPSTYTDLVLRCSVASDLAGVASNLLLTINSDSGTNYSRTQLQGTGSATSSFKSTSATSISANQSIDGMSSTADTFASVEIYIPSYLISQNKPISINSVTENNSATNTYANAIASLWSNTAAITSLVMTSSGSSNFLTGSSFYLYGIKNS